MKIAVLTLCYNEEETLRAVLSNWVTKVDEHVVLHSDKPWHGIELRPDKSEQIAHSAGATFIRLPWRNETEQRNWGLAYLYDCDYVLIVDADELYTAGDQEKILATLRNGPEGPHDNLDCYRAARVETYFKTPDCALSPPDTHKPLLAINPKKGLFKEHRLPSSDYQIPIEVTMHHLTYLRSDRRMYHKLRHFEHHADVKAEWFDKVWRTWKPGMDIPEGGLRAHGAQYARVVRASLPQELRDLL